MLVSIKKFWEVFVSTIKDFIGGDSLKYSASLSYYTVFSIAPVLIIIIGMAGIFFGEEAVSGEIYLQFSGLMGSNAAELVQQAIKNIKLQGQSWTATLVGIGTLLLGATGVFAELQDSLNKIWSIKVTAQKGWIRYLTNRLISFSMILTLGFLLMVSLLINTIITLLSSRYLTILHDWQWLAFVINNLIILSIVTLLFAFIFKFLPDAKLQWSDVWTGALFTSILFSIGKYLIGTYLTHSAVASAFGAAGSLAIILLWVYYSSVILFFGAVFTKHYAIAHNNPIGADDYAVFVVQKEKEMPADADVCSVETVKEKQATKVETASI